MRPPTRNDGVPSLRKYPHNQHDLLLPASVAAVSLTAAADPVTAQNRQQKCSSAYQSSEGTHCLCYEPYDPRSDRAINSVNQSESFYGSLAKNLAYDQNVLSHESEVNSPFNYRPNVYFKDDKNCAISPSEFASDLLNPYSNNSATTNSSHQFENYEYPDNLIDDYSNFLRCDRRTSSPLILSDSRNSITLVKNSASLIFTRKEPGPVVHRRRDQFNGSAFVASERRRSLQVNNSCATKKRGSKLCEENLGPSERKQQSYSWYAPVYNTLEEEIDQDSRESSPYHNLACAKKQSSGSRESASLLDSSYPPVHQATRTRKTGAIPPSSLNLQQQLEGPHANHQLLGGPAAPKCSRFEQLIKSLVGRKVSRDANLPPPVAPLLLPSPEIRITKSPSEHTLIKNDKITSSTASLNSAVQQKLWSVVPLLRRENSCVSLHQIKSSPLGHHSGLKKCDTVLALSCSSSNLEPIKPQNRLRNSTSSTITCSRCSSLLSLAANGSRYSLNLSNGGFVAVGASGDRLSTPKTPSANQTPTGLLAPPSPTFHSIAVHAPGGASPPLPQQIPTFTCKLCLGDVISDNLTIITQCGCLFCTECMVAYVEFEILEGAYEISCPDALCPAQGALSLDEITKLSSSSLLDKHNRYRLNREVELDKNRTWCPRAGCETVCLVEPLLASSDRSMSLQVNSASIHTPCSVNCPTCSEEFCSGCKKTWHPTMTCEENTRRLAADGQNDNMGIPFDNDLIKCCPMCAVPIEKDEGCAQMMCKRCKHVFCWYCLASLDDDFLLRHYDRGPCKNKLGHSRASVVWHRAQVIGIFAGFGILLLVASPLLLLAAPCIVCCKCRICSGAAKLEEHEVEFDEGTALHLGSRT